MTQSSISEQIVERETRYLARAQKIPYTPVAFERGRGALLYDFEGREYIDFLSSASSANVGHGNLEIARAAADQMARLAQYCMAYFPARQASELAEYLVRLSGRPDFQVAYSTCGSASIDGAINYARAFTQRPGIISHAQSYHGSSCGALAVSGLVAPVARAAGCASPEFHHINYPHCLRCPAGKRESDCRLECLRELDRLFEGACPPDRAAAVLMEPIAGDAGIVVPPRRYVETLAERCRAHGILLVSDEIQQGLGRAGKFLAMDHFGVECDLYALGKSLGGGLPMGALLGRRAILQTLDAPGHIFTHSGNATVCAAARAMLEILERDRLCEASLEKGAYLKGRLEALMARHEVIGEVRGIGLSLGVELVTSRETLERNRAAAAKISHYCLQHGLLLAFFGQNTLRVQPPLVITRDQMDRAVSILAEALAAYEQGRIPDAVLDQVKGW